MLHHQLSSYSSQIIDAPSSNGCFRCPHCNTNILFQRIVVQTKTSYSILMNLTASFPTQTHTFTRIPIVQILRKRIHFGGIQIFRPFWH